MDDKINQSNSDNEKLLKLRKLIEEGERELRNGAYKEYRKGEMDRLLKDAGW